MTQDRYGITQTDEGWYLHDHLDDLMVGEPLTYLEASIAADRLNRRPRVQENVLEAIRRERVRQDQVYGDSIRPSAEHLAIAMKKLGDAASSLTHRTPRERNLEQEVTEGAAVLVRWLEQLDQTR
jgi:hypothetical protein